MEATTAVEATPTTMETAPSAMEPAINPGTSAVGAATAIDTPSVDRPPTVDRTTTVNSATPVVAWRPVVAAINIWPAAPVGSAVEPNAAPTGGLDGANADPSLVD